MAQGILCNATWRALAVAWMCALSAGANAVSPPRMLAVDLAPLIDQAARDQTRFAVEVSHAVSSLQDGEWTEAAGEARWHYAVRIPTAISMSLHAERVVLPRDATLVVSGAEGRFVYTAREIHAGALWSRILRGDALDLTLSVPAVRRAAAHIEIVGLQAGYRGLGIGTSNHPYFDRVRQRATAGAVPRNQASTAGTANPNAGCIENYECDVTANNSGPAHGTVALVIANLVQCTGTLVNNVRNDGIPYVLTARHCEQGKPGGGAPVNAGSMTVYWDATTPCGTALGNLYDPNIVTQTGATTVVEQQDVWLVRLGESPVIASPYFAGFDATGGVVQGGYTLHHALSTKKQIVDWYGQAVAVSATSTDLSLGYASNFWGVSSQKGFFGPGASGGALFDQNDHLVGTASLGRETNGGPGNCPVTPLAAPTATTAGGLFTSLAAVWASTADTTTTTGATTVASVLDPDNTGMQIVAGASGLSPLVLTASSPTTPINTSIQLNWNASAATSCTADGGTSGDGWAGAQGLQGPVTVTSAVVAAVTYGISCTYPSGRVSRSTVTVGWTVPQPFGYFLGRGLQVWVGAPYVISWTANTAPCSITSNTPTGPGTGALTGLPASGSVTIVFAQAQMSGQLSLTCGPGAGTQLAGTTFESITPAVDFTANSTDRIVGQPLGLVWHSIADYCTPTGGAPNDGWTIAQRGPDSGYLPTVTTTGTFTYSLTCTSGSVSVTAQVVVQVENNAPYVTLQVTPSTVQVSGPYQVAIMSNIDNCYLSGVPGLASPTEWVAAQTILKLFALPTVGTATLQVSCSSNGLTATSPAVVLTTVLQLPPPTVTLTTSASTVQVNQPFTVTWSSTNATSCTAIGDPAFTGAEPTSGSTTITATTAGTLTVTLTCTGNAQSVTNNQSVTVTASTPPPPPPVTPPSSGGGGGGGGGLDTWTLSALGLLILSRFRVRKCAWRRESAKYAGPLPTQAHS